MLLDAGRMVLLLDGLNEMASAGPGGTREAVARWKEFLDRLAAERPGNRVVLSCRTLDYSAPLSTASLRVPQAVIEPMTDAQVEQYLVKHDRERGGKIWSQLRGTPQLEVMRSPYFLSLLVEQVQSAGGIPRGRASLFTGFVRRTLRREIERNNPLFAPNRLLTERDVRRIAQGKWSSAWELPERGALIPKLSELAFGMQARSGDGGSSQVRIGYDEALALLDHDHDEEIVKAGEALSILDEDTGQDEVKFFHQLIQEYFAGRRLAASPEPECVRTLWKSAEITPPLVEVLWVLPPAENLPPLTTTGWEETALLAGAMSADPAGFVRGMMETNLALAGRCARWPTLRPAATRWERTSNPSQPVVGVCLFEARAYTIWLSAQAGEAFRLPTEAEWEAAARGREGRLYAYGNEFDPLNGNTSETRIRRTTPVGVFVEGDIPEGVSDLTGNVEEWTGSLFGAGGPNEPATFRYPYRSDDGREDPSAGADVRRVLRGGAWSLDRVGARAASRGDDHSDGRHNDHGFRLSAAVASPISI